MLADSIDAYNNILTGETQPRKSIEDYKKDFEKATGIDASGKVDKSSALMAFGLAAMQNKAGRDFNVSNVLAGFGEAGEKALPALEKAKDRARAGQLAAGQFALQEQKADTARQLDAAKLKIDKISELQKQATDFQQRFALERMKQQGARDIELLKIEKKAEKEGVKLGKNQKIKPPDLKGVEINVAVNNEGIATFSTPVFDARNLGAAYGDMVQALDSTAHMRELLQPFLDVGSGGEGKPISLQQASEYVGKIVNSFGYDINKEAKFDKETGEYLGEVDGKPLDSLNAIRDRLINQFKRFLTQETGNGISNVDVQRIEQLFGKIDFFGSPQSALKRIAQVEEIFKSKQAKIESHIATFGEKQRYNSAYEYDSTQKELEKTFKKSLENYDSFRELNTNLNVFKIS